MRQITDLTGKKFNKLTVISYAERLKGERTKWLCLCDCGKQKIVISNHLVTGGTKSCGCLIGTHKQTGSRIYRIWVGMKGRCGNKNHISYKYYGGRGIKLCEAWNSNFDAFFDWSNNNGYEENLTIDRIYNDKDYSANNCRWADKTTQSRNQRKQKNCASIYIGVSRSGANWMSCITVNKKVIYLGAYTDEVEAAKVRDKHIVDNNLKDFTMNNVL